MKLLAAKFKLYRITNVLKKFGRDLKGSDQRAFYKPSYRTNVWDFKISVSSKLNTIFSSGISAASLRNLTCVKCGSETQVEMHHVRMMKDLDPKTSEIDRFMIRRRRKQIPLCRKCHVEFHASHPPKAIGFKRR